MIFVVGTTVRNRYQLTNHHNHLLNSSLVTQPLLKCYIRHIEMEHHCGKFKTFKLPTRLNSHSKYN